MRVNRVLENHVNEEFTELFLLDPSLAIAEAARVEIDGRIKRQREKHCERSSQCFKFSLAIRRKDDLRQSAHKKAVCGRFDCPACLRQWTIRQLTHAADRLICADPGSRIPRQSQLHVWTGPAARWEAVSKSIRRAAPDCGRARMIKADGGCLVVAEVAFPGSSPVSVLTAVQLAADAIENALHKKHSVRWLGRWEVKDSSEWEVIRHRKALSEVKRFAEELGAKVEEKKGFLGVRFCEEVELVKVMRFWKLLGACPDVAKEEERVGRIQLDKGHADFDEDFLNDPHRPSERYYAGAA